MPVGHLHFLFGKMSVQAFRELHFLKGAAVFFVAGFCSIKIEPPGFGSILRKSYPQSNLISEYVTAEVRFD